MFEPLNKKLLEDILEDVNPSKRARKDTSPTRVKLHKAVDEQIAKMNKSLKALENSLEDKHGLTKQDLKQFPELEKFVCYKSDYSKPSVSRHARNKKKTSYDCQISAGKLGKTDVKFIAHKLVQCWSLNLLYTQVSDDDNVSHYCHDSECWRSDHHDFESHLTNTNRCQKGYLYVRGNALYRVCTCDTDKPCMNLTIVEKNDNEL